MPSLTFLGAAGTVTGSKHLLDLGDPSDPHRLRPVPGTQGTARPQLAAAPDCADGDRRRGPDARAPRSLRVSAATGRWRFPRTRVLHARHQGPVLACAPRFGENSGRGRARSESTRLSAGTSRHCRCTQRPTPPVRSPCCSRSGTTGRFRWRRGLRWNFSEPAICSARPTRACASRTARRSCSAAISDVTAVRCCPIRRTWRRPTCCSSNRPTAIGSTRTTTTAAQLAAIVNDTVSRGGKLIVPAFAIGRVEEVHLLAEAAGRGKP